MMASKNSTAPAPAPAPPPPAAFELCEVCNLNHNHGRRHRYQSSHRRSLSALFSRFQSKLADLRFFLRHPSFLRPEHSALNRLWCVFCALDLRELDSDFSCGNAINHFASVDHLTKLKDFLRKHGGGMDRIDAFRVTETDFAKWEKGCNALKTTCSLIGEGPIGPQLGPSKDIRNELTPNHADSYQNYSVGSFSSYVTNDVLPLQSLTYEDNSRCHTQVGGSEFTRPAQSVACSISVAMPKNLACGQSMHIGSNRNGLMDSSPSNGMDPRTAFGEDCATVLQHFTRISSASEVRSENVHTGAPPPWLDPSQDLEINGPTLNNHAVLLPQTSKSKKLNPKRVGAAWAEKRRLELEMEKRGELVTSSCDANWLPNFGRVWQSGTRKESRKEFEKEKPNLIKEGNSSEASFQLQPYISKRMRLSSSQNDAVDGHAEDLDRTY